MPSVTPTEQFRLRLFPSVRHSEVSSTLPTCTTSRRWGIGYFRKQAFDCYTSGTYVPHLVIYFLTIWSGTRLPLQPLSDNCYLTQKRIRIRQLGNIRGNPPHHCTVHECSTFSSQGGSRTSLPNLVIIATTKLRPFSSLLTLALEPFIWLFSDCQHGASVGVDHSLMLSHKVMRTCS